MKKKIIIILVIVLFIAVSLIIIFSKKENAPRNKLVGTWTTDGVTIYQFDKDNTGKLIVSLGEYEFTYKIDDDKLYIDFKNEESTDSEYTYVFEDNRLVLKGDNGIFTFIKK